MKLKSIHAFITIVEAGSIRRAAEILHVSQPALTLAVQQLEQQLNAPLLVRSKQGVVPTNFGAAFLKRARLITAQAERAMEEVAQLRGRWEGTVAFATSPALVLEILPLALRAFRESMPNVNVRMLTGGYPGVAALLRDGTLDFALTPVHLNQLESDLVAEPLFVADIVIVARKGHALAGAKSLRELEKCAWVYSSSPSGLGAAIREAFSSAGLGTPLRGMECESYLTLPGIVTSSDMLSTLPRQLVDSKLWRHDLVVVAVKERLSSPTVSVLRRHDMPPTPVTQELISWLRHFAKKR